MSVTIPIKFAWWWHVVKHPLHWIYKCQCRRGVNSTDTIYFRAFQKEFRNGRRRANGTARD